MRLKGDVVNAEGATPARMNAPCIPPRSRARFFALRTHIESAWPGGGVQRRSINLSNDVGRVKGHLRDHQVGSGDMSINRQSQRRHG